MKSAIMLLLFATFTYADMNPPPIMPRSFRFEKLIAFKHSYVVLIENVVGAQNQIIHDPDCHCHRFTEEQIAKVVQEVIRLKDIEAKIQK